MYVNLEYLELYARSFIGVNYKWGGNNPLEGLDCSGLICEVLRSQGILKGDFTAQSLYEYLIKIGVHNIPTKGSILFFGNSKFSITHCALAVTDKLMIEAGGGDSKVISQSDAIKRNAFVRIRPIDNRRDLIASISLQGIIQ